MLSRALVVAEPDCGKSAHANRIFHNVEELNGAEVYRRLIVPTSPTSVLRRNVLRDRVQNARQAESMATITDSVIDEWGPARIAFGKAGGKEHETEEQCSQIMKMLPDSLSFEMLSTADDYKDPEEFIGWLRQKSRFI